MAGKKRTNSVRADLDQYAIGAKLRKIRLSKKRSISWIARRCNMDPSNYHKLELGRKALRLPTLLRILRAWKISARKFWSR